MRTRMKLALMIAAVLVAGACTRAAEEPPAEPESLDVTSWTEKTELFMEYPPLVGGRDALFAVHLTRLSDFSAINAGRTRIEFTDGGGPPATLQGNAPSRPGVFRVEGRLPAAGRYRWALVVETPDLTDRHDLGAVVVFPDDDEASTAAEPPSEDASAVAYLKEQQWTTPFATAIVSEGEFRSAIRVPAAIEPLTGGEATVSAPRSGRFVATTLPSVGDRVRAGQTLGRLEPRSDAGTENRATLVADVDEARARLDAARVELSRAERLLAERAVPGRRVEDAQRAVSVAETRLRAAEAHLEQHEDTLRGDAGATSSNAFVLRAPIAGRVAEISAALGATYDEGAPLFRIVRTDRVELQAQVPAADAPLPQPVVALAFEVPGRADPIDLTPEHVHDAGVIDPRTRALPVQIEVANPGGQLLIGQTGTAVIYTGARQRWTAIPRSAVLMDAGRSYVFVQVGGESFVRRFIEIAAREGNRVGVRSGVTSGDRVVTEGAYEVQLASAAGGLPAEGHVH